MHARLLVTVSLFAACSSQPSRLDNVADKGSGKDKNDPWSSSAKVDDKKDDDKDGGALGGLDLKDMLSKIGDAIEKPGPYEAPEKSADYDEAKPHWGVMNLSGGIVEREAFSLRGGRGIELRTAIDRLRALAKDDKLTGVVLRVEGVEVSLPDVVELRTAMHDFRTAGKKLVCHTEDASNATYLVLAACDQIGIAPLGQIAITGPAAMPIHVKGLLDKLGVTADFLHVGAYKGAAEPLTRDAPSTEMQETLGAILDRRYQTMVEVISAERKLDAAAVKGLIDQALFPSEQARTAKLVDEVSSFEAFRDKAVGGPWTKLEVEPGGKDQLQKMLKLVRFIGAMPPEKPLGAHVAVVYAVGDIVDGGGDGVLGARQQIASHTMVAALRALNADASVKAVVLRIDSGGGSAQASELIWQAVTEMKANKPVVVSMSDVAASGGYYIASNANKIFAEADTLTGSIGVVGGKIAPGGALAKLGVTTFPIGRGKRATMMASLSPWNAEEKAVIQNSMEEVYKVFVGRVASGRNKKPEDIQPIAQGRVWTGVKAKELGLVDEIGGLDAALAEARTLAKLDDTSGIEVYPPSPTLRDFLVSFGGVQAPLGLKVEDAIAALGTMDPVLAAEAARLVRLALSFHATTIQAVTILPVLR
ncbi:MAG: signal peptide peptidase SppA [Polyangiales bacterium]